MTTEILTNTLGLGSPQGARKEGMGRDLLGIPQFAEEIDHMDSLLGVASSGSLNPELQTSSVSYTIAVNKALAKITGKTPGLWIAPSIGENSIAALTGAIELDPLLPALAIRQRATSIQLTSGLKKMVATFGLDADILNQAIAGFRQAVGSQVEIAISNFNAPQEMVLAMSLPDGHTVAEFLTYLQSLKLPNFKAITLDDINHAYHSQMIRLEQTAFETGVKLRYGEDFFKEPNPEMRWYSPMLRRVVQDKDQVKNLFFHQLTETVYFDQATYHVLIDNEVYTVIGSDATGTSVKMAQKNFPKQLRKQVKFLNVKDRTSFDQVANHLSAA